MTIAFSSLAIGPRIQKRDGKLIAQTGYRVLVPSLGLYFRKVTVDPKREKITIARRLLWCFKQTRVIPFRFVSAVFYRYSDVSGTSNMPWSGKTFDHFIVGLRLSDNEEVPLFHFFGEGAFVNNTFLPDWLYWQEYVLDSSGTQEQESRAYVELVKQMINVPLIP
jgi:hypothetical protein